MASKPLRALGTPTAMLDPCTFLEGEGSRGGVLGGGGGNASSSAASPSKVLAGSLAKSSLKCVCVKQLLPDPPHGFQGGPAARKGTPVPRAPRPSNGRGMQAGWGGKEGQIHPSALVLVTMNSHEHQQESGSGRHGRPGP